MADGVLVLNSSLTPVIANPAARSTLGWGDGGLPAVVGLDEWTSIARRCMSMNDPVISDVRLESRDIRIRAVPLEEGVALFLHDVTEELGTQQLRRQFAANASHELKTPVASLATLVEAIQTALTNDQNAVERFVSRLSIEVERLRAMIDDLMDLSRVEDPAAMRVEDVSFDQLVAEQLEEMQASAIDSNVHLTRDLQAGTRLRGDRQHLELMVRNLLDNAVRYTPPGGNVRVALARDQGVARFEVEDTGIGIPLGAQSRVFERFFRVDADRARASGGTGLGLSIVKHVAEAHGGSVSVTSNLDEGSTFSVLLPLGPQSK
jgi:two-component system sensor histidine kinase SenX3